ncbi:hypothetical protein H2279_08540, partial [Campylobacter sp. B0100352/1]|nr:hypothetical protein [Campylobacter sp. B0100352/1]
KNQSLSKKFLFSLATVSVLSTCADAKINGGGCNNTTCGTVSSAQNTAITVSETGNTSLTITSSGSVKPSGDNNIAINFQNGSSLTNFKNEGTIQGGSNTASIEIGKSNGATITTFENSGIIGDGKSKYSLTVYGSNDNKSTIENFTNSGIISSNNGESIFIKNTTINNFTNSGTINSIQDRGINISSGTTISTFENSGTIKTTGTSEPIESSAGFFASYGVNFNQATIENFTNTTGALISGKIGINLSASSIKTLINKGTIESTSVNELAGAINIHSFEVKGSTINNLTNEGVIKSQAHGILIGDGNTIENLTNQGTIEAGLNGITFHAYNTNKTLINLGQINLESGSIIKAGRDGIHIDGSDNGIQGKGIDVKKGATLQGDNAGIFIGGGKQLDTLIKISG